jgi:hypothetical protein
MFPRLVIEVRLLDRESCGLRECAECPKTIDTSS